MVRQELPSLDQRLVGYAEHIERTLAELRQRPYRDRAYLGRVMPHYESLNKALEELVKAEGGCAASGGPLLETLKINERAIANFSDAGIHTVTELITHSEDELWEILRPYYRFPGIALNVIVARVKEAGLELETDRDEIILRREKGAVVSTDEFKAYVESKIAELEQRPYSDKEDIEQTFPYYEKVREALNGLLVAESGHTNAELQRKHRITIEELELSIRASNCFKSAGVETVGQLLQKTDEDLLKLRSFGRTSLREVKRKLDGMGLKLKVDSSLQ